jgi:hypothetical protein
MKSAEYTIYIVLTNIVLAKKELTKILLARACTQKRLSKGVLDERVTYGACTACQGKYMNRGTAGSWADKVATALSPKSSVE